MPGDSDPDRKAARVPGLDPRKAASKAYPPVEGRNDIGKHVGPSDLPTIGFAALKRKMEEAGIRIDDSPGKRSRRHRMSTKMSFAYARSAPAEVEQRPVSPFEVAATPIPEIEIMEETPAEELPPAPSTQSQVEDAPVDTFEVGAPIHEIETMEETPTEEPPSALSAPSQPEEAPVSSFEAEPPFTETVNLKETFTTELHLSASPAPTAVEPPPPTTPVVPKKGKQRPRKSIPSRPVIKLRPSRPKKDGTKRVSIVHDGVERVVKSKEIRRLNTSTDSPVSNLLSQPAGSSEDSFFDLVASVENAILGNQSAPKDSSDKVTVDQLGSPARQARSDETVGRSPIGRSTQNTDIPVTVVTALTLHLSFLSLLSKREIPELYETSQTFWVPKTHEPTSTNTTSGEPHPTRTDELTEPTFFYWDPMALASNGLLCPSVPCGKALERFGHARSPRPVRVQPDDADVAFWMIGARYRCSDCTGQQRKDKPKADPSYVAWDERIMSQLPDAARKEFPAVEMRKQFVVAEDHRTLRQWADPRPAKSPELVALSRKWPAPDSTNLDGFSSAPQDTTPAPGSPFIEIHATDPVPLSTPGSAKPKAKRSCSKGLQAACKGNRTIELCANACIGCKRFSCVKAHREGRNACLESGREVLQSPSRPKPRSTDLENSPRRDRNREVNNRGTEEEKEEKSVEEVLGLI